MQSANLRPESNAAKGMREARHLGSALLITVVILLLSLTGLICWYLIPGFSIHGGYEIEGNVIHVRRGGDLQAAIDRARPGDTIMLEAGATFKGAFNLPKKSGQSFVTIRSSASDDQLTPEGHRIEPEKVSKLLPKILSNVKGVPAVLVTNGAHHYRLMAIEFGPTIEGLNNIIQIGTGEELSVDELPFEIEFDRVFIHGDPSFGQRRGIAANGRRITIKNSHISDIKMKGDESQAIAVWASDGPVIITNNYLEAAAENILFGGGSSRLKLVPTDCVVADNHLNKPLSWRNTDWVVKNLFEIKNGKRIKIVNNLMTHNWRMGQDGTAVLFTVRADNGNASVIEDIEFAGNIVRGAGGGLNILGGEGGGGRDLTIRGNLFEDINGSKWGSAGHFMKVSEWDGLVLENNTILQTGNIANVYGRPSKRFIFRNNIVFENEYGIRGDNMGSGQEVVDLLLSRGVVSNNVIIGGPNARYRMTNFFPPNAGEVGFVDARSNFNLRPDSRYSKLGDSGSQIGAQLEYSTVGRTRISEPSK